jgi:hypothetical protein
LSNDRHDPTTAAVDHLMSISDAGFDQMLDNLSGSVLASESDVERAIRASAPNLETEAVESIVGFALAFGGASARIPNPERFHQSVAERAAAKLGLDPSTVSQRIARLLGAECLVLAAVAQANSRDGQSTFQRATVSTDLRAAMSPGDGAPRLFTVVHRLQIDYTDASSDSDRVVEFILDHDDLESLVDRANAALSDHRRVQSFVTASGGLVWDALATKDES